MKDIRAYYNVSDLIATSGQPTIAQFSLIAAAGYRIIINLALPTSSFAIANEGELVESLGMTYVHIPVSWEAPQLSDLHAFFDVMRNAADKPVWIHCALNMRASCFLYLYRTLILRHPESAARYPMAEIWQPSGVWARLISDARSVISDDRSGTNQTPAIPGRAHSSIYREPN